MRFINKYFTTLCRSLSAFSFQFWQLACRLFVKSSRLSPTVYAYFDHCLCLCLFQGIILTLPNIRGAQSSVTSRRKIFGETYFFPFYIRIFNAFWLNFIVASFQLLKLWTFFEWRCSQNDKVAVKTLYELQILEIAVNCKQLKMCTRNRILVFRRILRLWEICLQFILFSLCFYCSLLFSNNRIIDC